MKYSYLAKEKDLHARAFSLVNLRIQFPEQGLDIAPLNVPRDWAGKDSFERFLVLSFHG